MNYRLKQDDISYIFQHSDVEAIIVDAEFLPLLDAYRKVKPNVPLIIDLDTDETEGELSGPFDEAVLEGLKFDKETGGMGWSGLETHVSDEESIIALAYTSGTTARPKGVECTHRGVYLGAVANVIESGLNFNTGRCRYLWTLPMFHATGTYSYYPMIKNFANYHRLDLPLGNYCSSRNTLLSPENRLPTHLAFAQRRKSYTFQRCTNRKYVALQ